jgi:hypothetical protein
VHYSSQFLLTNTNKTATNSPSLLPLLLLHQPRGGGGAQYRRRGAPTTQIHLESLLAISQFVNVEALQS